MVARVIIGTRSGAVGMWVSKPGKSAYSTTPSDFIIDTTTTPLRPIIAGTITNPILNADSGNFHAPSISSQSSTAAISSTVNYGGKDTFVFNVSTAYYTSDTGNPNKDGIALYYKDYYFKADHTALLSGGQIPLTHISIGDPNVGTGSAAVGDNYPKVYIDDTKIRLAVYQNWDAVGSTTWYGTEYHDLYYPNYYVSGGYLYWNGGTGGVRQSNAAFQKAYYGPTPPSTLQTNCVIHYAVYNKSMSLP